MIEINPSFAAVTGRIRQLRCRTAIAVKLFGFVVCIAVLAARADELKLVITPDTMRTGITDDIVLSLTNSTAGPGVQLLTGERFDVFLDLRGGTLVSLSPVPILQGPNFTGKAFDVQTQSGGSLSIQYLGPNTNWTSLDAIQLRLKINTPNLVGIALFALKSPTEGNRFGPQEWSIKALNVIEGDGPISESMRGPKGEPGQQGPQGLPGIPGPIGPRGLVGEQGIKGDTGLQGVPGPIGPTGAAGPIGPTGMQGVAGPAGQTGATGQQGPIGLTGATGPAGETGATGPQGPLGLTGATGPAGETGATGPQGPIGLTGASGPAGETGATGPAGPIGPPGATGPAGETGSAGPQGPSDLLFLASVNLSDASNVNRFAAASGHTAAVSLSDIDFQSIYSAPGDKTCALNRLRVRARASNGNTRANLTITMRLNESDTDFSCQTDDQGLCTDTITTTTLTPDSLINFKISGSSGVVGDKIAIFWSCTFTSPAI